ncbi:MAG: Fic family protein [Burkholderiaceae bacterium]
MSPLPNFPLWVHPFLDGNGRVARLISYAMMRGALDTGGMI